MMRCLAVVVLFLMVVTGSAAPAYAEAEEELFDTKAAAEHLEMGISLLGAKKYDAAIEEFEESTSIAPDAEAFYYLGYAYYMKGKKGDGENRKKAIENFDRAYEINPNFTPTKFTPAEPVTPKELQRQEKAGEPQIVMPAETPEPAGQPQPDQPAPGEKPALTKTPQPAVQMQ